MQLCGSLSILWHCLSLGLEWKLTYSNPVATAGFSKFAGILNYHIVHFNLIQCYMSIISQSRKKINLVKFLKRSRMQLVLLNCNQLYPNTIKVTPSTQLLKSKASPLNCDLQHLSLLWPSLTTSSCCLCVCVFIPCVVFVIHKETLFCLSVCGFQFSF